MKQRRSHIKSVFGVAIVIGVVWYIANSSTIINGKGWFERQQFPLNNHLACVVIGALVVAISIQISALVRWYRKSSMQLAAGVNGMSFEATITKSELQQARALRSFDHWDQGFNMMRGVVGNVEVSIFDLYKKIGLKRRIGENQKPVKEVGHTVFLFELPRSSEFRMQLLRKQDVASTLTSFMGYEGVRLDADGIKGSDADCQIIEQFNRDVMVTQGWVEGTSGTSSDLIEQEAFLKGVKQHISLELMRYLLSSEKWNLELGESHIAIWQQNKLQRPSSIQNLLRESHEIYRLFSSESEMGRGAKLNASGESSLPDEIPLKRFAWIAGGGFLGMVIAFAVMIPLLMLFSKEYPWLLFAWPVATILLVTVGIRCAVAIQNKRPSH